MSKGIEINLNRDELLKFEKRFDLELPYNSFQILTDEWREDYTAEVAHHLIKPSDFLISFSSELDAGKMYCSMRFTLFFTNKIVRKFDVKMIMNSVGGYKRNKDRENERMQNLDTEKEFKEIYVNFIRKHLGIKIKEKNLDISEGGIYFSIDYSNDFYFNLEEAKNIEYKIKLLKYRAKYDF